MTPETGNGKVLAARLLCAVGILLALIGAFFISIALNALGIVFGMLGYALGARWLGPAAVVLALVTLLAGLLLGQGVVPGAYDRITDGLVN
jgi:type III secretory pathway component EscR